MAKLASKRSERDTIRGVQIRVGAVYVYMCDSYKPERGLSRVITTEARGGSPRVKVLLILPSTEYTVYKYRIVRAGSDACSVKIILVTNIYYTHCCHRVKGLSFFQVRSMPLFVRKSISSSSDKSLITLWEVPKISLLSL